MENKNIKVGDVVICINNVTLPGQNPALGLPPLRIGGEYVVQAINKCPCGEIKYDIGLPSVRTQTCRCERNVLNDPIWWCAAERFVKKQTLQEQIEEAVESENFELAAKLQNDAENQKKQ